MWWWLVVAVFIAAAQTARSALQHEKLRSAKQVDIDRVLGKNYGRRR